MDVSIIDILNKTDVTAEDLVVVGVLAENVYRISEQHRTTAKVRFFDLRDVQDRKLAIEDTVPLPINIPEPGKSGEEKRRIILEDSIELSPIAFSGRDVVILLGYSEKLNVIAVVPTSRTDLGWSVSARLAE